MTSIGAYAFDACDALESVYYAGANVEKWWQIDIEEFNSDLFFASRYYYSETQPTDTTCQYWHYVDGVPTPW